MKKILSFQSPPSAPSYHKSYSNSWKKKEKKEKKRKPLELLKKKINKCKRNIGLELSFLSKVAQCPSNPQMLYPQSDFALPALGRRLLYYSPHCLGHLGESLLNLTLWRGSFRYGMGLLCFLGYTCTGVISSYRSTSFTQIQFSYNLEVWISTQHRLDEVCWSMLQFLCLGSL